MNDKVIKQTIFKGKDVRLLRERLAWVYKKSHPEIQKMIADTLLQFAKSVAEYCQCEEKAFVALENKYACLNCGRRHSSPDGDVNLKLI